jgi:hypothetical protein
MNPHSHRRSFRVCRCIVRRKLTSCLAGSAMGLLWQASIATAHAAELSASDGATNYIFGISVSQSGSIGLAGAYDTVIGSNQQGAAYVYRDLDTASGTVTQTVELTASDAEPVNYPLNIFGDDLGFSVSLSGSIGLVGAPGVNSTQGAAYVFRNLNTASGAVTQDVKLVASDGVGDPTGMIGGDLFGSSVSQSGTIGLVGAEWANVNSNFRQGAAYVYRNLDTASGTVTQDVKLTASDGQMGDVFGSSVSLSGTIGLVGALGVNSTQGAAYVFRNLDTASGTVHENVKLTPSDAGGSFGSSVSLSGSIGLIGARYASGTSFDQGAAYVFRNLDTASGTVTQDVKLIASDGAAGNQFGYTVSLSGNVGLVGATQASVNGNAQGAAYLYRNLDTANGTVMENVKIYASDAEAYNPYNNQGDEFGVSVSLSGDQFIIGALQQYFTPGKAYTGTVSSLTTLDAGSASRTIDGISFVSQNDWIIGQNTSGNQVILLTGNSADVTASGKAVYVGQNVGSNNNTLLVAGSLTANQVNVGAAGNTGNKLVADGTVISSVNVARGSTVSGHGSVGNISGAGLVAPGDPQILTATQVDPSGGLSFAFSFTQPGSPNYASANAGGNDVVHLTGATPFVFALTAANTVTVDFSGATLLPGQTYLGGFFTDVAVSDAMVNQAAFDYTGLNGASVQYEGLVTEPSAAYATGTVTNGEVMEFQVMPAPEPGSAALLALGGGSVVGWRRRRASV